MRVHSIRPQQLEDFEIVHHAILEAGVAEPIPDRQIGFAICVGDILAQFVANHLQARGAALQVNSHNGGVTRTIIGESDLDPFVGG